MDQKAEVQCHRFLNNEKALILNITIAITQPAMHFIDGEQSLIENLEHLCEFMVVH